MIDWIKQSKALIFLAVQDLSGRMRDLSGSDGKRQRNYCINFGKTTKHQTMPGPRPNLKTSLFSLLALIISLFVQAQPNLYFENLGIEDGLLDLKVMSILQDRKGFMWFGTEMGGLCRYDGQQMKVFSYDPGSPEYKYPGRCVSAIFEDEAGYIWSIGGPPNGLHRFDPTKEIVVEQYLIEGWSNSAYLANSGRIWVGHRKEGLLFLDKGSGVIKSFKEEYAPDLKKAYVRQIVEDETGDLWFSYPNGIYQWTEADHNLVYHPFRENLYRAFDDHLITSVFEDSAQNLWAGTKTGLYLFDRQQKRFRKYAIPGQNSVIISLGEDQDGYLWIGHEMGLFLHHPKTGRGKQYSKAVGVKGRVQGGPATIYRDPQGTMWLGQWAEGIDYWSPRRKSFRAYQYDPKVENSLGWNTVSGLCVNSDDQIWVACGQLQLFNPKEGSFVQKSQFDLNQSGASDVMADGANRLWVNSWGQGLRLLNAAGRVLASFQADPTSKDSLPGNAATFSYADRQGNIWVGVWFEGLFRYLPEHHSFLKYPLFHPETKAPLGTGIKTIHEDRHGRLWIGEGHELSKLTTDYTVEEVYDISTHQIHEDTAGMFWIASLDGLVRLDPQTGQQRVWRKKDGLPVNDVHSILADDRGGLWLGTKLGLAHFDIQTEVFTAYDVSDGLPGYQFNTSANLKTKNGEFYFGLREGMLRFHPDSIQPNPHIPPVVITDFKVNNASVPIKISESDTTKQTTFLENHIAYTDEVRLTWRQNDLSLSFSALNYLKPEKNQYKYRLDNYDEQWTFTDAKNPTAIYTNLDPGKYTFQVIGSNNDGVWNNEGASLSIIITPPWWATWWAYGLYGLLILGALYGIRTYELKRKLAHYEASRLRELDAVKGRLYTNITHEFRTPISIILGITGQVKKQVQSKVAANLEMIERNGKQLLHLVNQLLDLSRLESGKFELNYVQGDIIQFLKYLTESFHSLAEQKAIQLHFLSDLDSLSMDYDPERLQQVFYNLLSNALKFTPEGGNVYFQTALMNEQFLELKVKDTGIGIPQDQIAKVFDRFYQLDDSNTRRAGGTGIGLALVRELVRQMGGTIAVKSKVSKGTEFILTLPIRRLAALAPKIDLNGHSSIPRQNNIALPKLSTEIEGPRVLVIEDNPDVRHYIQNCLISQYQVEMAFDGEEGIQKAQKIIPDLILCDVMMPIKDGFEVCDTLKQDRRTSHIPIIMLTAKADFQSKLQGLKKGADIYLAKPFQEEELLLNLQNLLLQRERLQQHYQFVSGLTQQSAQEGLGQNTETDFVECVKSKIYAHLTDNTFTVSQLSREMTLSESQLHRKLKALTGYSANKMIRMIRLNNAKRLLQDQSITIAAVAYDSGFNDPDYMAKVFKKEFGMTPTEFKKSDKTPL